MDKTTKEQGYETRERIYQYVVDYMTEHGYPPTVREIADGAYLCSTSSVHRQLQTMFADGTFETDATPGSPRAIRVPGYKFVKK